MKKNFRDKLGVLVRIIVVFSIMAMVFEGEMSQYTTTTINHQSTNYKNIVMFIAYVIGGIMIPCVMLLMNKFNNEK